MQFVTCDFESTRHGVIHTICLIPLKTTGNHQKGLLIFVKDVIQMDEVNENPDVRRKLSLSMIKASKVGLDVQWLDFHDAIVTLIDFVTERGSILIGHNLIGDLGFLVTTQNVVGGKRIIKNRLKEYPDTGTYDSRWESITKICSMSLISTRCHKFNEHYYKFVAKNKENMNLTEGQKIPLRLETYSQFVNNCTHYSQTHEAVQDTVDLVNVMKAVIKYDGKSIISNENYIVPPIWRSANLYP